MFTCRFHRAASVILGDCGMSSGIPKRQPGPQRALHRWPDPGVPCSRGTSLFLPSAQVLSAIPSPWQPLLTHRPCASNSLSGRVAVMPLRKDSWSWLTSSLPSSARGQAAFPGLPLGRVYHVAVLLGQKARWASSQAHRTSKHDPHSFPDHPFQKPHSSMLFFFFPAELPQTKARPPV